MLKVRSLNTARQFPVQELRETDEGYKVKFGDAWLTFTRDGKGPPNTKYVMEMTS